MPSVLQSLTEQELVEALSVVDGRNDMFPPRDTDKVAGRIAAGFARGLHARLQDRSYVVERADFVPVRKSGLLTRPAAVLRLQDRVVYESLVARMRPRIQRRLPPSDVVIWPRADGTKPDWKQLETGPLTTGAPFIVLADVAGFYESIDHTRLRRALADAGIEVVLIDTVLELLKQLMGDDRGIPQGLGTSDSLATLFLAAADFQMLAAGLTFARHGDDYRILASTESEAVRAAHLFEQALRDDALLANARKLRIVSASGYAGHLRDVEDASVAFREKMQAARVASDRKSVV